MFYKTANHDERLYAKRLWLIGFAYAFLVAVLLQLVVLPYVLPSMHLEHGLMRGFDFHTFHLQSHDDSHCTGSAAAPG